MVDKQSNHIKIRIDFLFSFVIISHFLKRNSKSSIIFVFEILIIVFANVSIALDGQVSQQFEAISFSILDNHSHNVLRSSLLLQTFLLNALFIFEVVSQLNLIDSIFEVFLEQLENLWLFLKNLKFVISGFSFRS